MVAIYKTDKMDPPFGKNPNYIHGDSGTSDFRETCVCCLCISCNRALLLWCAHWLILPHAPWDRLQSPPSPQLSAETSCHPGLTPLLFQGLPLISYSDQLFSFQDILTNCLHISPYSEEETNLISMNTFMNIWKKKSMSFFKICHFQYFSIEFLSWNCILNSHEGNCVLHGRQLRKYVAVITPLLI